jgi:5'-nucleotidase
MGMWLIPVRQDIACHAYDDALCVKDNGGIDAVFMCAGTFRGDSVYGPGSHVSRLAHVSELVTILAGEITLGDILQILPWEDPFVLLEVDGEVIWATLESALSKWPAQEGWVAHPHPSHLQMP